MSFHSPLFLFLFLPGILGSCTLATWLVPKLRPLVILMISLAFYGWNDPRPSAWAVVAIWVAAHYGLGFVLAAAHRSLKRPMMWLMIFASIFLLIYSRLNNSGLLNGGGGAASLAIAPLGLSFMFLNLVSYTVDIYRGVFPAERNPFNFALYIFFFPKLLAGPLARFKPFQEQLATQPRLTLESFAYGVRRLMAGLIKKLLLANTLAMVSDAIFVLPAAELTTAVAWLGLAAYTLQIYYDFAGYTDMALGLAGLLGFRLPENFDQPYLALSVIDFWRRWHMTLSNWFRDYVFFPLERWRRQRLVGLPGAAILIVFILTGLWHGFSLNFMIWGGLHGLFVILV